VKLESPAFTKADFEQFQAEIGDIEKRLLVSRLRAASGRMQELAAQVPDEPPTDDGEWNAKEVLAHIAVVSKGWGALAYLLAKGRMTEVEAVTLVTQRDPLAAELLPQSPVDIAREAATAQQRSIAYLETAPMEEFTAPVRWELGATTAEHIFRTILVGHLELHVSQLERMLQPHAT
jgi:DinB superfamily